jgi:hypothetical protein
MTHNQKATMTRFFALITLIVAGCTPIHGEADPVDGRITARFTEYPGDLFMALEATCNKPNERFVRRDRNLMQCRSLLPPQATAAIILNYDGTIEDLPELVVQFSGAQDATGYILENRYYLHVPRRGTVPVHVIQGDWVVERRMRELMQVAGGSTV